MPNTPQQNFPYPAGSDTPDVPRDMKALAEAVDTKITAVNAAMSGLDAKYVNVAGDTMTGVLTVPSVTLSGAHLGGGGQLEVWNRGMSGLTTIACANASYANQAATLGQVPSSREKKQDITPMGDVSGIIDALKPVTYRYRADSGVVRMDLEGTPFHGFIAEDVEAAGLRIVRDPDGNVLTLRDQELIGVLVAEVQSLRRRVAALE